MRVSICRLAFVALAIAASGCQEEGTIKVHSLSFNGVKDVDAGRLKAALATHQSSRIRWGKKYYFDRSRLDADLKRIQAFYADRGYPDARVTGFDVKLNDKQDEVDTNIEPVNPEQQLDEESARSAIGAWQLPTVCSQQCRSSVPCCERSH